MKGKLLRTYKMSELPDAGRRLQALVNRAKQDGRTDELQAVAALTWDSDSGIPMLGEGRGYPLLLVSMPATARESIQLMSGSALVLEGILHPNWPPSFACMTLTGHEHVLELPLADLLPLLRLSNQGCILVAFECADEVTLVEYDFGRIHLLKACALLLSGYGEDGTERKWQEHCYQSADGKMHWQPMVVHIDDEERF
jgi:hypothetical protein